MNEIAPIAPTPPTAEEITIAAAMAATTAAFDWRGEGGLSSIEVVNTCGALVAFLEGGRNGAAAIDRGMARGCRKPADRATTSKSLSGRERKGKMADLMLPPDWSEQSPSCAAACRAARERAAALLTAERGGCAMRGIMLAVADCYEERFLERGLEGALKGIENAFRQRREDLGLPQAGALG